MFPKLCSPRRHLPSAMNLLHKNVNLTLIRSSPPTLRFINNTPQAIQLRRYASFRPPTARPTSILDRYVETPVRPISLRQLIFFGSRNLDSTRILNSANYVRTELPVRIAQRIRDMQHLPYVVVTNSHLSYVFDLYYSAFDTFRRVPEITTLSENEEFCTLIRAALKEHLSVIPRLAIGVLESRDYLPADQLDTFMSSLLRSRISRRVIAEQHLSLTDTFNSPEHFPDASANPNDFVGEVFLRCSAAEIVQRVGRYIQDLSRARNPHIPVPEIKLEGHLDTTFPYILSHLEYIIGELLRNSLDATIQHHHPQRPPPPITVLICNAPKHIIFRVSDQGGGIPPDQVRELWSFAKAGKKRERIESFEKVPMMAATLKELRSHKPHFAMSEHPTNPDERPAVYKAEEEALKRLTSTTLPTGRLAEESTVEFERGLEGEEEGGKRREEETKKKKERGQGSLESLTYRPPELKLGLGLPMCRVYAEYWGGKITQTSLEGYGTDVFLTVEKLGNRLEQLGIDRL